MKITKRPEKTYKRGDVVYYVLKGGDDAKDFEGCSVLSVIHAKNQYSSVAIPLFVDVVAYPILRCIPFRAGTMAFEGNLSNALNLNQRYELEIDLRSDTVIKDLNSYVVNNDEEPDEEEDEDPEEEEPFDKEALQKVMYDVTKNLFDVLGLHGEKK